MFRQHVDLALSHESLYLNLNVVCPLVLHSKGAFIESLPSLNTARNLFTVIVLPGILTHVLLVNDGFWQPFGREIIYLYIPTSCTPFCLIDCNV